GPAIVTPPPVPAVLPAKVLLRSASVPSQFWRPPPAPAAVLPVKVQSVTVSKLPSSSRPPPSPALELLPEKVQLLTVIWAAPVSWKRPPPLPVARLLAKVLLLTTLGVVVLVLELSRPPP